MERGTSGPANLAASACKSSPFSTPNRCSEGSPAINAPIFFTFGREGQGMLVPAVFVAIKLLRFSLGRHD
jgi:hypothetical protein